MALVLPFDATYVRYARPLWRFLASSFSSLRVVRVRERVFPEILQDVVLLLAAGFGGATGAIELDVYESVADLVSGRWSTSVEHSGGAGGRGRAALRRGAAAGGAPSAAVGPAERGDGAGA